jgi:hypothetical protein
MSRDPILDSLLASADALDLDGAPPGPAGVASGTPYGGVGGVLGSVSVDEGTVTPSPSKLFSIVVIHCSDSSLCFGLIGAGGSVCVKQNCFIKNHSVSKARFSGQDRSMVFIQRGIPETVFSEPNLDMANVPLEILKVWRTQKLGLSDWSLEFQAVDFTNDASASSDDVKEEASFLSRADKVKTPSKKRREVDEIMESDFVVLGWKGDPYQRILPHEGSLELENQIAAGFKKGVVTRVVAGVESKMESMNQGLIELSQLTHNRFLSMEEAVREFGSVAHSSRTKIGRELPVHERFEAPTLWGTTSFIADELDRVNMDVTQLIDDVEPLKAAVGEISGYIINSNEAKDATNKLVQIVSIIMRKIQGLAPEMANIRVDLNKMIQSSSSQNEIRSESRDGFRTPSLYQTQPHKQGQTVTAVDELLSLACDERSIRSGGSDDGHGDKVLLTSRKLYHPVSNDDSLTQQTRTGGESRTQEYNSKTQAVILKLVEDVKLLRSSTEVSSIKFGNLGFRNLHECTEWIESHFSGLRYGLIMDPLLMLERIYGDDEVDSVSLLKTLESRLKLKIETGAEASALNALRHSRPRIFHKGRPIMINLPNKSRLNLVQSHTEWKSGGEGVKSFIVQKMNILHASVAADISCEFGRDPSMATAQMIATMSLTATVTFITQLLGMVDTLYERLFVISKFSTEQAWSLTSQVLDRVLSDLYAPKDGIGESLTTRSPLSICAHLLWASFKTHDVMAEYVAHNFENHPAVSTEYVKFLATNSGSDKVSKLVDQVELLKSKATSAADEAKRAVSKADTASTKTAELIREVASLTKRLKALEDKSGK